MRTLLRCDVFIGDEEEADAPEQPRLRVFPGPRGIVIADAVVPLSPGHQLCHGQAFAIPGGIEFVYHCVHEAGAASGIRRVPLRFVVKAARYEPGARYSIRHEHLADAAS